MKLLELIVKNVKREAIHKDSNFFAQDGEGFAQFKTNPLRRVGYWSNEGYIPCSQIEGIDLAEDASTKVVTREELMRAYDLVEQGYTLWFGGDCPVDDGLIVEVSHKDGSYTVDYKAKSLEWNHYGVKGDIVAYKLKENNDEHEFITVQKDFDVLGIVRIITEVMPGILAVDAIEIANSLIDEGYHK